MKNNHKFGFKENEIRDTIFEYLIWRGHFAIRDKQGTTGKFAGAMFKEAKGVSDIWGIQFKTGLFFALEVKKPNTKKNTSEEQEKFLARVKEHGGLAGVVTCLHDVRLLGL